MTDCGCPPEDSCCHAEVAECPSLVLEALVHVALETDLHHLSAVNLDADVQEADVIRRTCRGTKITFKILSEFSPRKMLRHLEEVSPKIWGNERAVWRGRWGGYMGE